MNLSFNLTLKDSAIFPGPLSILLYVLEGKKKSIAGLLPFQMRATYGNFFISCCRVSSFLLKPYFSINHCLIAVYHVRISEELKTHQKEQYFFLAQDTICGKHFPFMVIERKQMITQQSCPSKSHSLHFAEMQPEKLNRKVRNWSKSDLTL